eukprot:9503961-Pyramimonas_sp.AAC.3
MCFAAHDCGLYHLLIDVHKAQVEGCVAGLSDGLPMHVRTATGTRENIPGVGANRRGLERIFQGLEPIAGD